MKVQELKTAEFKPIHIQVTFESKEEIRSLMHRLDQTPVAPQLFQLLRDKLKEL